MDTYYIYQNNIEVDKVIVTSDTGSLDALGNWLDDNGYNGHHEMIGTNHDGIHYVKTDTDYFEIKKESSSEIKESVIQHFNELLNKGSHSFQRFQIQNFKGKIEKCFSDHEVVNTIYEWENDVLALRSRGETMLSHLYQAMFDECSSFLP